MSVDRDTPGRVKKILACLFLLTACHDKRPPAPTEEQARQLNDAEDMLNDMARNEERPQTNASAPSS